MAYSSWKTKMPPSEYFTRQLLRNYDHLKCKIMLVPVTWSGLLLNKLVINGALGHGGEQPVALLVLGKTMFALITAVKLYCSVLCLIPSLWHYLDSVGFRSGQFAGQLSTVTPCSVHEFLIFLTLGRCQIELEISISMKFVNIMKHNVL